MIRRRCRLGTECGSTPTKPASKIPMSNRWPESRSVSTLPLGGQHLNWLKRDDGEWLPQIDVPARIAGDNDHTLDDLPPGQYKVCVIAPEGFEPTLEGVGDSDQDSSTGCAISRVLTVDGERDPTLDFGFAKADALLPSAGSETIGAIVASLLMLAGVALLLTGGRKGARITRIA